MENAGLGGHVLVVWASVASLGILLEPRVGIVLGCRPARTWQSSETQAVALLKDFPQS